MPINEKEFRTWYKGHAEKLGLNPDPDNPLHYYDYRAAYKAGVKPDKSGHWPSKYKRKNHPRMFIDGVNTKTGKKKDNKKEKKEKVKNDNKKEEYI